MSKFGKALRARRIYNKMTQKELAWAAGMRAFDKGYQMKSPGHNSYYTNSYISKAERGTVNGLPSTQFITSVALALDIDPEIWLDLAGKFEPKILRIAIEENPDVGVLVRRLQNGKISKGMIKDILMATKR